jgi:hypothetical protein
MNWHKIGAAQTVLTVFLLGAFGCSSTDGTGAIKSTGKDVEVSQLPMTVKKEFFDRGSEMSAKFAAEHNQSANTHWQFQCVPKFSFNVLEKNETGTANKKIFRVKLEITAVHVDLSAPVIVYLPTLAKPEVVSHEDGHVKICRKVYESAAARAAIHAAENIVGKEYNGTGSNLEEACQVALHRAAQDLGLFYRSDTIDVLDRVSYYYDQFTLQHPEPKYIDSCVDASFKADNQITTVKMPSTSTSTSINTNTSTSSRSSKTESEKKAK